MFFRIGIVLNLPHKTPSQLIKNIGNKATRGLKPIYKFPHINALGLINRLKFYQTVVTAAIIPSTAILTHLNLCSTDDLLFATVAGVAGLIPMYGLGHFANKFVGILYLDEEQQIVKVAYLNFWGKRKDIIMPVQDIKPFTEVKPSLTDVAYLKLCRFSDKEELKLFVKRGILDSGFNKVFY